MNPAKAGDLAQGSLISPLVRKIHAEHAVDHAAASHESSISAPETLPHERILQMINMHCRRASPHLVFVKSRSLNMVRSESCLLGQK